MPVQNPIFSRPLEHLQIPRVQHYDPKNFRWFPVPLNFTPANICLFKVNKKDTRKRSEICPKLTINIPMVHTVWKVREEITFYTKGHGKSGKVRKFENFCIKVRESQGKNFQWKMKYLEAHLVFKIISHKKSYWVCLF